MAYKNKKEYKEDKRKVEQWSDAGPYAGRLSGLQGARGCLAADASPQGRRRRKKGIQAARSKSDKKPDRGQRNTRHEDKSKEEDALKNDAKKGSDARKTKTSHQNKWLGKTTNELKHWKASSCSFRRINSANSSRQFTSQLAEPETRLCRISLKQYQSTDQ